MPNTADATMTNAAISAWKLLDSKGDSCNGDDFETWTIQRNDLQQERRFFVHIPASICQEQRQDKRYPILLAFHGYGGHPLHEFDKWKSTSDQRQFILVTPEGTMVEEVDDQISWNAVDCCGTAVSNQVDDIDFVNGVVEILKSELSNGDVTNVVATGFSNGGFFTSLLGLQPSDKRPSWIKAIVPTDISTILKCTKRIS